MLIEHRTYTAYPGKLDKQIADFEKYGLKVQKRHFGDPVAWLVPETGDMNSYVHIWAFEDFADLEKKHAALVADPEWQAYLARSAESGYLMKRESKLMTPASFAPIKR